MKPIWCMTTLGFGFLVSAQPIAAQQSPCLTDSSTVTAIIEAVEFNYSGIPLADSLLPKVAAVHVATDPAVCTAAVQAYNTTNGLTGAEAVTALFVIVVPDITFVLMAQPTEPEGLSTMIYYSPDWCPLLALEP